jgi:hypothetical protein
MVLPTSGVISNIVANEELLMGKGKNFSGKNLLYFWYKDK